MPDLFYHSPELPYHTALQRFNQRVQAQAPRCPLRYHTVLVTGPGEGYVVCDLGFAVQNGFVPVM